MTGPDQSLEDILASIKRAIVDEDGPAPPPLAAAANDRAGDGRAGGGGGGEDGEDRPAGDSTDGARPDADRVGDDFDDVLELTRPLPPVAPRPAMRPPPAARPAHAPSPPSSLVSPVAVDASRQALAYLSSLKLKSGDPADDTLAALVRELLRPMLRAWLDAELPGIVERAVVQEIARLGGPKA